MVLLELGLSCRLQILKCQGLSDRRSELVVQPGLVAPGLVAKVKQRPRLS